ncbi:FAD-binding protein [Pseudactinotalea sp. HY158]|nr:FAD-binding protein [Pseudactinotalea sp. HY158]
MNPAVADFPRSLRDAVITRDDPEYARARAVWNGVIDRYPLAVVRCRSVDDVRLAVEIARRHLWPLAVRGGGHSVAGHGTVDDGLVLDLARLTGLEFDPDRRLVTAGGGATWGQVDAATQAAGLAVPGGVFSRTGIAGLTLGGGYGWIRNRYGLSCASLVRAEMVTADSEAVTASATENPELLWALRGSGGNVGVVTSFTYRAHPVGPRAYFLFVFHDARAGRARRGLRLFRDFCRAAPGEVSTLAFLGRVPDAGEGFAAGTAGWPFVGFAGLYVGDPGEGASLLSPLREFSRDPLADASGVTDYVDVQQVFDADYPDGGRYYWKSVNLETLDEETIDLLAEAGRSAPSDLSTIDLWHNAGAATGPVDGALSSHAAFMINPEANWVTAADDPANIHWVRELVAALTPKSDGSRYLNFAGFQEEGEDAVRATFRDDYVRLARIKARWDPENCFRLNQNVHPAA